MKKALKIIIPIIIVIAVVAVIIVSINSKPKTNLPEIASAEDLVALVDKLYEGNEEILFPSLQTQIVDITNNDMVKSITGLENGENLEFAVVSEPMMSSQAYSLVLAKVKDGVNPDEIAKQMNEKIDARKWICVSAEKVYSTSSGEVVCLIMSNEEIAKPIYEKFKELAGIIGQEYEKAETETELPEEML